MMGRNKTEGAKNIVRQIDQPRFQRVWFTRGDTRLQILISNASYDKVVAGFESRGFKSSKYGEG